MGQIHQPHEAEDQRKAGSHEKEQHGKGEAVEKLQYQEIHVVLSLVPQEVAAPGSVEDRIALVFTRAYVPLHRGWSLPAPEKKG